VVEALGEEFGFFLEGSDAAFEGANAFVNFFAGGGGSAVVVVGFAFEIGDEGVEAVVEVGEVFAGGVFFMEGRDGVGRAEVGFPEVEGVFERDDDGRGDDEILVVFSGAGVASGGEEGRVHAENGRAYPKWGGLGIGALAALDGLG